MHQQSCQVHDTVARNFHISALLGPQSPLTVWSFPSEANSCSAGEEMNEGSLRYSQQSSLDPKLSQINLFYNLTPISFRIHFSNVLIHVSRSPNWSRDQNFVRISHFPHNVLHTYPSNFPWMVTPVIKHCYPTLNTTHTYKQTNIIALIFVYYIHLLDVCLDPAGSPSGNFRKMYYFLLNCISNVDQY